MMKATFWRWLVVAIIGAASIVIALRAARQQPLYGHAVFGPSGEIRLKFIAVGTEIFVDQNSDDVPQRSEFVGRIRINKSIELVDRDSSTAYTVTGGPLLIPKAVSAEQPQVMDLNVAIRGPVQYGQSGGAVMTANPWEAGVAHFHGPVAVELRMREELCLRAGGEPTNIRIALVTYRPDQDHATDADWKSAAAVRSNLPEDRDRYAFPPGVVPELELAFPTHSMPDVQIRKRFPLDQFC